MRKPISRRTAAALVFPEPFRLCKLFPNEALVNVCHLGRKLRSLGPVRSRGFPLGELPGTPLEGWLLFARRRRVPRAGDACALKLMDEVTEQPIVA